MFLSKVTYSEDGKPVEIKLICNKCESYITVTDMEIFDKVQSDYCVISHNKSVTCNCGNISEEGLIEFKKNPQLKHTSSATTNIPKCPYCNSTDLKKISGLSKAGSVALWGIFAVGKVSKQWHCNNCKSDF